MTINLSTVLDQDDGQHLVEEYLDKKVLPRRQWNGILANSAYGTRRPMSYHEGQYTKYTRKKNVRRPEHMASPGGAGSDPASGITLGVNKVVVPIEWIHEYAAIGTVARLTSWMDLVEWAEEDLPTALKRRMHELTQNAFAVGRMAQGVYASDGSMSTAFDASAEATVTLYDVSFTFQKCPIYYGDGRDAFTNIQPEDRITWLDLGNAHTRLSLAKAPKIKGGYVCCLSESMKQDLIEQDKFFEAAIRNYSTRLGIDGLQNYQLAHYKGWHFMIDDQPFTEEFGSENVRADYGPIHSAQCFGAGCFGYMPMGRNSKMKPKFKIQDTTKTGYEKTIGYLVPWQVAILNPDWGCVIKAPVSMATPNNDASMDGFEVS